MACGGAKICLTLIVRCFPLRFHAMMIDIPKGTSSAVKSSKQVCGTSTPAWSQFNRYPQNTSTWYFCLSDFKYATCGFTNCQRTSICCPSGADSDSAGWKCHASSRRRGDLGPFRSPLRRIHRSALSAVPLRNRRPSVSFRFGRPFPLPTGRMLAN